MSTTSDGTDQQDAIIVPL